MGLFRQHLDHEESDHPVPEAAGRIGYDAGLVDSLLRDHAELGRLYGRIGVAIKADDFDEVSRLLASFKARLHTHLLAENLHFYNYLEQTLADDPASARMVHTFRVEMNEIAGDIVAFIKQYQSSDFSPEQRRRFARDYATVGERLEHRLDCEEDSLFRLYRPR